MQNETWHCLDLITMDFPWKTSSWWQYMSLYYTNICLNGTLTHMPVTHAVCSAAPPYHDRCVLLHLSLIKSLEGPFGLWDWELDIHFSQVEMWTHLSTAHISTVFFYYITSPPAYCELAVSKYFNLDIL